MRPDPSGLSRPIKARVGAVTDRRAHDSGFPGISDTVQYGDPAGPRRVQGMDDRTSLPTDGNLEAIARPEGLLSASRCAARKESRQDHAVDLARGIQLARGGAHYCGSALHSHEPRRQLTPLDRLLQRLMDAGNGTRTTRAVAGSLIGSRQIEQLERARQGTVEPIAPPAPPRADRTICLAAHVRELLGETQPTPGAGRQSRVHRGIRVRNHVMISAATICWIAFRTVPSSTPRERFPVRWPHIDHRVELDEAFALLARVKVDAQRSCCREPSSSSALPRRNGFRRQRPSRFGEHPRPPSPRLQTAARRSTQVRAGSSDV